MTLDQCLEAVIVRNPQVAARDLDKGGVELSLPYRKPWLFRLFSAGETYSRRFQLDEIGSDLWRQIDDRRTVQFLVERLKALRGLAEKEAVDSTVAYVHMLLTRGLVGLVVPEG
jgi:hypothetical protein